MRRVYLKSLLDSCSRSTRPVGTRWKIICIHKFEFLHFNRVGSQLKVHVAIDLKWLMSYNGGYSIWNHWYKHPFPLKRDSFKMSHFALYLKISLLESTLGKSDMWWWRKYSSAECKSMLMELLLMPESDYGDQARLSSQWGKVKGNFHVTFLLINMRMSRIEGNENTTSNLWNCLTFHSKKRSSWDPPPPQGGGVGPLLVVNNPT